MRQLILTLAAAAGLLAVTAVTPTAAEAAPRPAMVSVGPLAATPLALTAPAIVQPVQYYGGYGRRGYGRPYGYYHRSDYGRWRRHEARRWHRRHGW